MAVEIRVIVVVAIIATSLTCVAFVRDGTATFYTDYIPSACYGYENQGTVIAAANPRLYNNGAACGRSYRVRCTGGTNGMPNPCGNGEVVVRIVDLCPGCGDYQLDLSKQVFSRISHAGRIRIDYTRVY